MNDRDLFIAALQLKSSEERAAYLNHACGTDQECRQRIEKLLQRHEESESFLNPNHIERAAAFDLDNAPTIVPQPLETTGDQIGPFKLLQKLGDGGMGTVWVAEQEKPVKRRVALKLVKAGMDSTEVLRRFEAERQALAMMDHTNIAKVFDAGTNAQGRPYFVMELIKGVPITRYCDEVHASIRDRLDLFIQVCSAVQHAHQKGIIHRDIKPSNVLVAMQDGKPVPKVIDFGVAKALHTKLADRTMYTEIGQVVGTLEYMAPEQAELSAMDIDTRADIYALGILLYELLTGSTPITRQRMQSAAFVEILRIIKEEEPPKPSTRLSESKESMASLASLRRTDPKHLSTELKGDLDWVVLKALEKDRTRRYETANGLSRDLQRYLANETVEARPPSTGYRLRKFVARNKGKVLAAGLLLGTLILGMIGTTWGLFQANTERKRAEAALIEAEKSRTDEAMQRQKAETAEANTLADYRASTDDAVEQLIGSKLVMGPQEKAYLEKTLKRWQSYADRQGDAERSRAIRAEGHFRVGFLWSKLGHKEKARAEYQAAIDILKNLTEQFPTEPGYQQQLAATYINLGAMLYAAGKLDEARTAYQTALAIQNKLVEKFPSVALYQQETANNQHNMATTSIELGKFNNSEGEYLAAREIQRKLVEQNPNHPEYRLNLSDNHNNMGILMGILEKREKAQEEYQMARAIQAKLVEQFPTVPSYRQKLSVTHCNLAMLLSSLGKQQEARIEYDAAYAIQKALAEQFPTVASYQEDLSLTHCNRGNFLFRLGKKGEAQAEYVAARSIQTKLVEQFPGTPSYQQHLAATLNNLGTILANLGKQTEAKAEYQAARTIQKKLVEQFPGVPDYKIELGGSYCNYGNLLQNDNKPQESLEWLELAIQVLKPVNDAEPRSTFARQFLRNSHENRARAYNQLSKPAEAIKDWDRVIELSSAAELPIQRAGRASSLYQAGMFAEAVAEVSELTKSMKWSATHWFNFACVYSVASTKIADKKQEYADRAMELLQQAVKAGFKDAAHMAKDSDLNSLRGREDFKKLLAELDKKN